jgi:hypothetical protein
MHNRRTIWAALTALKGMSIKNVYARELSYTPPLQKYINLRGLPNKIFCAHEPGAQGGLFDEKNTEGRKSRDNVPLKEHSNENDSIPLN